MFICHVVSSLPHHDVVLKECYGKHVLPLWSPRSKWPTQEISLISLTLGNFLPGNWPCRWHSCLIYLLIMWQMTCGWCAEDARRTNLQFLAELRPVSGVQGVRTTLRMTSVVHTSSAHACRWHHPHTNRVPCAFKMVVLSSQRAETALLKILNS